MSSTFAMRFVVPRDVLVRELDGESVILDLNSGCYFGLDEVGTRMWTELSASRSVEDAFERLAAEFDVEADVLRHDLGEFVDGLVDQGLAELRGH